MLKLLLAHGWQERWVTGSHHHLYKNGVRVTVPIHGNQGLGPGLEHKILKEAGLSNNVKNK